MINLILAIIIISLLIIIKKVYRNNYNFFNTHPIYTKYRPLFNKYKKHINKIPKVIWSYWHDTSRVPTLVIKCIDTWLFHNEDYEINILNDSIFEQLTGISIAKIFSITNNKSPQKKSDFIRLSIIYLFGGIWLDASIICSNPLTWIHKLQSENDYEFIGFLSPDTEKDPIIDSWFMAAIPNSLIIYDILNEFTKSLQYPNDRDYGRHMDLYYPIPPKLKTLLPYLTIHLSTWIVTYNNSYNIHILSSTTKDGPLYYIHKFDWNERKMCKNLIEEPIMHSFNLFKLTGPMRSHIMRNNYKFNTSNKFINYVLNND